MKKILLIDNTFDPPHGSPEIHFQLTSAGKDFGAFEVVAVRAPEGGIPRDLTPYSAAVLSGSKTRIRETAPWIEAEMEAIRFFYKNKIPTLGICYGEQLIARTLGGDGFVRPSETGGEFGWVQMQKAGNSPLLEGIPETFFSFQFHSDEVSALPDNFVLRAFSEGCAVQAYDLKDAPIWGIQFHPERTLEVGQKGLERKLKADPNLPVFNFERASEIYDPSVAKKIFRNFLARVWADSP